MKDWENSEFEMEKHEMLENKNIYKKIILILVIILCITIMLVADEKNETTYLFIFFA